jgi:hypothetical protein
MGWGCKRGARTEKGKGKRERRKEKGEKRREKRERRKENGPVVLSSLVSFLFSLP